MEISAEKTKLMSNNTSGINTKMKVNGQTLEKVTSFKYLGSVITDEGFKPDILSRLAQTTDTTEPRYLKLVTVSSFYPFTLISFLMPLVFVISLVFSALISKLYAVEALSRRSTNCQFFFLFR